MVEGRTWLGRGNFRWFCGDARADPGKKIVYHSHEFPPVINRWILNETCSLESRVKLIKYVHKSCTVVSIVSIESSKPISFRSSIVNVHYCFCFYFFGIPNFTHFFLSFLVSCFWRISVIVSYGSYLKLYISMKFIVTFCLILRFRINKFFL